jgi:diaminopimelate decarboxylase
MFNYKQNKLFCENIPVEAILKKTGTPVYIYSKDRIVTNYANFDKAFSPLSHLICYAVKANTNFEICKTIFALGSGADIVSGGELHRTLRAGVNPSRVIFAGVGKTENEIIYAARENILMFNAESVEELENINRIGSRMNKKLKVAIRVNPNIDAHTHQYITTGKGETKFGIPMTDAPEIYKESYRYKNLEFCGIHCHIGSQLTSIKPYVFTAKKLAKMAKDLKANRIDLKYINIGGGLGIKYHNEKPPAPKELANSVLPVLKGLMTTLILEPGRYIVADAGILVTKIIYRKTSRNKKFLVVDAGMTDLIRPALYGAYHDIVPVNLKSGIRNPKLEKVDVVGPVCETSDYLGKDRFLPHLETGEYIAVRCARAYCFSMPSKYNSRARSAEVLVNKKSWKIIRKRETYKDLVNKESL